MATFKDYWPFNKKIEPVLPKRRETAPLPKSRVSQPDLETTFADLKTSLDFVKPQFFYEYIPVIRRLYTVNSSVSLSANSIMELANTGYKFEFDPSIPYAKITKMKEHLNRVTKRWGFGTVGLHGLINKLILQTYIGGAMSTEWVLNNDLTGIKYLAFVNPEKIRVAYNKGQQEYEYYQIPKSFISLKDKSTPSGLPENYIKMNPYTYQYYGLLSDEEKPIGIPPFLSALDDIQTQLKMLKNIGYVSDQLGLLGFLEVLLAKPDKTTGESDTHYAARLGSMLTEAKTNIKDGTKDGIVSGFQDDHEFNFHATAKDTAGAAEVFDINQRMVSNGLQTSPQFLGGSMGGTETMVTVVFTKMLSQLTNIQKFVKAVIERGLYMELLLAGFDVNYVNLIFKPSTIADELKSGQADELTVRNSRILYADGIISLTEYANRVGYDKADQKEPRAEINPDKIMEKADAEKADQKAENKTAQKTRDKKKPQPKK